MSPSDLATWMQCLGLKKAGASAALGIARTTLNRYLSGSEPIPRLVSLACEALEARRAKTRA